MHHIGPRFSSFAEHQWPPEPPDWDDEPDYRIPIIIGSVFYTFGFLLACCVLMGIPVGSREVGPRGKPWIPTWARDDACLRPIFFVLPALLWPLVFPAIILAVIYFFLKCLGYMVWNLVSPATTCCGIPLPRRWTGGTDDNAATASSPDPDLEMGPVAACAEDGEGREPGSGVDNSVAADVRSAGSSESERPPSYTSQLPDEDEDNKRETDGLLAKSEDEVETDGK